MKKSFIQTSLALFLICGITFAQSFLPIGNPLEEGFSAEGIERISSFLNQMSDQKQVPGSVALVVRNGKVVFNQASGWADMEEKVPMRRDHLFRMASMTKIITTVAALKLFERGYFTMDTPLETFLPEFANPTIFESYDENSGTFTSRPSKNKILMKHVFTHTSGITYPAFVGEGKIGYDQAKIVQAFPKANSNVSVGEELKKLAKLPLAHEPGESWTYGMNMDVLGRVIEVLTGQDYPEFVRDEIFIPLKMNRSYFGVPKKEWKNLAKVYTSSPDGIRPYEEKDLTNNLSTDQRASLDYYKAENTKVAFGGADMVSCAQDYARFLQMLLNYGSLDGVQILSKKTIEMLETPLFDVHTKDLIAAQYGPRVQAGLSVRIMQEELAKFQLVSKGSYYWGGYFNTQFWMDRKEQLFYIVLTQYTPDPSDHNNKLKHLVWGSIAE
jgi:CubicO group peptidase (beta-lactamase class C family)